MIRLEPENIGHFKGYWTNGKHIGDFIQDVDGFYYWQPPKGDGYWSEEGLKVVTKQLHLLNKTYNKIINNYFKNEHHEQE